MRSLMAAILTFFLPPRGAHRAAVSRQGLTPWPPCPPRPPHPHSEVILADGLPLVRPYVAVWERERDELDRQRLQRARRRAAVLATLGQDYVPLEAAV
ncbi:hypothetical protein SGFS_064810 [Streptomyces graminofaciens]|uniref:Uncharacterized protein n=1 Tax=Streptomyces graminofaciens TaxID=68212 RepID=A0ABN5VNZ1_9ACTN|nr:hypothetical protein [Streptomyces graminofaciens]BBC35187.1 hypothetical protein SGFS_064810 [Streptomyces graminofaciens]